MTINLTGSADIDAKGRNSVGIWAQSVGTDRDGGFAAGDITISIGKGSVVNGGTRGETYSGAGIELRDGTTTTSSTTAARSLRAVQMPSCTAARAGSR